MFGQTVTVSSDVLRQFGARGQAHPRKSVIWEGDGNGGGIVPYRYRRTNFHNAVQWAAGLELFLLVRDPSAAVFHHRSSERRAVHHLSRPVLAADEPRDAGAWIAELPAEAMAVTTLPSIAREYSWTEIATMTRAAPARLLGLADRGHLAPGARADIAVYRPQADLAATFRMAALVFKDGTLIFRDGEAVAHTQGRVLAVAPDFDRAIERRLDDFAERAWGVAQSAFDVPARLVAAEIVPCAA